MKPEHLRVLPWIKVPDRRMWIKELPVDGRSFLLKAADIKERTGQTAPVYILVGHFKGEDASLSFGSWDSLLYIDDNAEWLLEQIHESLETLMDLELANYIN